jgi:hypothetical protein
MWAYATRPRSTRSRVALGSAPCRCLPERRDARGDEQHPQDVPDVDAVAAWEGHEDDVPSVRVEADQDRPDDDPERSQTPAHCGQGIGVERRRVPGLVGSQPGSSDHCGRGWTPRVVQPRAVYVEAWRRVPHSPARVGFSDRSRAHSASRRHPRPRRRTRLPRTRRHAAARPARLLISPRRRRARRRRRPQPEAPRRAASAAMRDERYESSEIPGAQPDALQNVSVGGRRRRPWPAASVLTLRLSRRPCQPSSLVPVGRRKTSQGRTVRRSFCESRWPSVSVATT